MTVTGTTYKMATRDLMGRIRQRYMMRELVHNPSETVQAASPGHEIMIVDVSGSMYQDLPALKDLLIQYLTVRSLDERGEAGEISATLISYSSAGQFTIHFSRVTLSDLLRLGSQYQEEIRSMQARGLTCITQALNMAKCFIRPGEDTGIILHSDGYANDPSPRQERRGVIQVAHELAAMPGVFIDTVAYSDSSDFQLLDEVANIGSGRCVRAYSVHQVHEALRSAVSMLSGGLRPTLVVPELGAGGGYQLALVGPEKIVGSAGELQVCGVPQGQSIKVYQYTPVTEGEWNASSAQVAEDSVGVKGVLAYSRAMLSEGRLMEAKYALVGARIAGADPYYRALTGPQIKGFVAFLGWQLSEDLQRGTSQSYSINGGEASVMAIFSILNAQRSGFLVDLKALSEGYKRRGIKRLTGRRVRAEDGSSYVLPPDWELKLKWKGRRHFFPVTGIKLNNDTATANVTVSIACKLVERATGKTKRKVAGIDVSSIEDFRNYTLIGDGEINVKELRIRITSLRLYRTLQEAGALVSHPNGYQPNGIYKISLEGRPLIQEDRFTSLEDLREAVPKLMKLGVARSALKAIIPGHSPHLTRGQVDELKAHHLTPALYYSAPTTTAYEDLQVALDEGKVDTRLSYRVTFGTASILNPGHLYSANAFLGRRFSVLIGEGKLRGESEKKPTMIMTLSRDSSVVRKRLTARTKITPMDDLMMPMFEDLLGVEATKAFREVIGDEIADKLYQATRARDEDTTVELISDCIKMVEEEEEAIWKWIRPLVFYIGATGVIPDIYGDLKAMDVEELVQKHPSLNPKKKEKDGTFFDLGGVILSIFSEPSYFSTARR
jgi:hypothetical protein